jgi:beta-glucosidase
MKEDLDTQDNQENNENQNNQENNDNQDNQLKNYYKDYYPVDKELMEAIVTQDIKEQLENDPNKIWKILFLILCVIAIIAAAVIGIHLLKEDVTNDSDDSSKGLKFLSWKEAHDKAKEKLNQFTTEEKLSLLYGSLNMQKTSESNICVGMIDPIKDKFGGICLQDGPAGVRFSQKTQSWQAGINTASTFNKTLMYEVGKAQGKEFREKGINVALGPAMNMQRSPQGGRIWECYGDDPFLSGVAATQVIKGIQSNGVIACAKHFVGNDQETNRKNSSSNIKEQALWEIYMEPFYRSVKDAEVGAIMAAYNAVNGTYCVNNSKLLTNYLKEKIGFQGYVMSDWWEVMSNSSDNFNNGLDMNMPGGYDEGKDYEGRDKSYWSNFKEYLENGEITNDRLNDAVERILSPMYKLDQFNDDIKFPGVDLMKNTITNETKKLNREAAAQSNVLLKNEGNILPLRNTSIKTIAIIGNDATQSPCIQYSDCSCKTFSNEIYRGHLALGYGSGTTYFNYLIDPLSAITERAEKEGIKIISSVNIDIVDEDIGGGRTITVGKDDIENAKIIADQADLSIVFINADSGEQYINLEKSVGDRYDLNAWHSGNDLVNAVLDAYTGTTKGVIVVINAPGPIEVPWLESVQGLIFSGLGGAESGNAVTSILFGDYNPSGHLPYIWAENENYPAQIDIFTQHKSIEYAEGVFVGQRYFDKYNKVYTFPFGYGLSYTTFEFVSASFQVSMNQEGLKINFSVKNTGSMKGETVPMVFLKFPESIKTEEGYPDKLFKGFDKKWINPNEVAQFEILVDAHALSYYNVFDEKYERPTEGKYTVYVGFDAKNYNMLQAEVDASF